MLVDMKDKQSSFVGSREWIGAIEIQMCLDKLYGVRMRWIITSIVFIVHPQIGHCAAVMQDHACGLRRGVGLQGC